MKPGCSLLLVEAEPGRGRRLASQLGADGWRVDLAETIRHARVLACCRAPAVVLIGHLQARETSALLQEIRDASGGPQAGWQPRLPVIVLGCGDGELELLRAFEAGADEYLPAGAGYLELRARLRALIARSDPAVVGRRLRVGALAVDLDTRSATLSRRELDLRRMEFELLATLAREPARVFSRGELLAAVWGFPPEGRTRTLDSHASRLRGKLGAGWVVNVRGVGYRLR